MGHHEIVALLYNRLKIVGQRGFHCATCHRRGLQNATKLLFFTHEYLPSQLIAALLDKVTYTNCHFLVKALKASCLVRPRRLGLHALSQISSKNS